VKHKKEVTSFYISLHTELHFMHIATSFLCFTTQNCTSCTLLCTDAYKRGDNVHEVQFCVVKHKKEVTMYMKYSSVYLFFMFHYTQLYFIYIVTSFPCFTTHSCTSCTLSPLIYVSLHRAVLHVYCQGDNVHEVQLCV
jgi:hypothetical protein